MKISLENYLRNKLDEVESMHSFELATDTIRCWIDEYNDQLRQYNVSGRSEQLCECKMKTLPDGNIRLTMCKKCVEEEGLWKNQK